MISPLNSSGIRRKGANRHAAFDPWFWGSCFGTKGVTSHGCTRHDTTATNYYVHVLRLRFNADVFFLQLSTKSLSLKEAHIAHYPPSLLYFLPALTRPAVLPSPQRGRTTEMATGRHRTVSKGGTSAIAYSCVPDRSPFDASSPLYTTTATAQSLPSFSSLPLPITTLLRQRSHRPSNP